MSILGLSPSRLGESTWSSAVGAGKWKEGTPVFEYLFAGLRLQRTAPTSRQSRKCQPTIEGLADRITPSVAGLGTHALVPARFAVHHHHHHRHLTPAVLIMPTVAMMQPAPGATDPGSNSPALASGIQGQVRIGPISPVARPGVPNDKPLAGARIAISRDGTWMRAITVTSDANGNFTIALTPGDYTLVPLPLQPGQTVPRAAPQTVHVSANMFTSVVIEYDTEIR
jgi:hypothetical protein